MRFHSIAKMKIVVPIFFTMIVFHAVKAGSFNASNYDKVDLATIKATPEEYKNKRIYFETRFRNYKTTFKPYIENSGYKSGKFFLLKVVPSNFPVMFKKSDENNKIVSTLGKGRGVKLYGKVKKFRATPKATRNPRYYLELEKLELLEKKVDISIGDEEDEEDIEVKDEEVIKKKRRWKRRGKWKNK